MKQHRAPEPGASSYVLNFLAVVLPLLNLWNVALEKGVIRSSPTKLTNLADAVTFPVLAVAATLIILFLLTNFAVFLLRFWLKQCYGFAAVDQIFHNFVRDSGLFIALTAVLSLQSGWRLLQKQPSILWTYLRLRLNRRLIYYGQESSHQKMEFFFPPSDNSKEPVSGLVIFVHGGAWGSGSPAMYRLVARPFLKINWAVAVLGYRLYPEGDASIQIEDMEGAAAEMLRLYPNLCRGKVCLIGHSSGAHICLMALVERARRKLELSRLKHKEAIPANALEIVDYFCGVSGPYNPSHHFDFETGREVEQISPLKPACGDSRPLFLRYSPADQLKAIASQCKSPKERQLLGRLMPRMTLVHDVDDEIVPCSSSKEAARVLHSTGAVNCEEVYIEGAGHEETVMEVMLGGQVQDILCGLLQQL